MALGVALMLLAVLPKPKPPRTSQQTQVLLSLVVNTARQELSLSQPRKQRQGLAALPSGLTQGLAPLACISYSSVDACATVQHTKRLVVMRQRC